MPKWIILAIVMITLLGIIAITVFVEREAPYHSEKLARGGTGKALILYHPSRDAQFADELTLALAQGFEDAKLAVERRTMTRGTPAGAAGFDVIAVVSNTFYAQPDWPTRRYLKRARFQGIPAIGIIAGSGRTKNAQTVFTEALAHTGAELRGIHPLWIARPNDPARVNEDNRLVAASMARKLAFDLGRQVTAERQTNDQSVMKMTVPITPATIAPAPVRRVDQ